MLRVLPEPGSLARAAAEEVLARTTAAVRARGRAAVALAGGSTPAALYRLLADAEPGGYRARLPWDGIHFFWGDERHVPPDHPDSNYRMAREAMLARAPVTADHVHRILGEIPDALAAAAAYEQELRGFFSGDAPAAGGLPRFDLVLLGMGADGHTASLFPGTAAVHETTRWVAAPWVARLRTHRVTLTPPVLNHAAAIVFLVSGADKAETLRAVLQGPRQPDTFPSQVIQPTDGECLWLVERSAAALLATPAPHRGRR
jgi:6-phosphogluconolactonase